MAKITFHHTSGHTDVIDAPPGTSLMRAAVTQGVPGIIGEPEASHVLDTVKRDATGHAVSTTLVVDRRHVRLNGIVVKGHYTKESIRILRSSEEFLDGTEERIRLLDVRHVTALVDDDQCSVKGTRALLG